MSRDGGYTWKEIRKGAHLFEVGDSGRIIILFPENHHADTLIVSLDAGDSWH